MAERESFRFADRLRVSASDDFPRGIVGVRGVIVSCPCGAKHVRGWSLVIGDDVRSCCDRCAERILNRQRDPNHDR